MRLHEDIGSVLPCKLLYYVSGTTICVLRKKQREPSNQSTVEITNKKEQMPPQRLITLTRGIQIRGQPIRSYKKI